MVDNLNAKTHLGNICTTLDSVVDYKKLPSISTLLTKEAMDLKAALSLGNLFVDKELKDLLKQVKDRLDSGSGFNSTLNGYESGVNAEGKAIDDKTYATAIVSGGFTKRRYDEYSDLYEFANYFNVDSTLNDMSTPFTSSTTALKDEVSLASKFKNNPTDPNPDSYELCTSDGIPLKKSGKDHTINIGGVPYIASDYIIQFDSGGPNYTMKNVIIDGGNLYFGAMEIDPPITSKEIELSVNAIYTKKSVSVPLPLPVACNKKFKLNITDGLPTLNQTDRENVLDDKKNKKEISKFRERTNNLWKLKKGECENNFLKTFLVGVSLYTEMSDNEQKEFYKYLSEKNYFDNIYKKLSMGSDEKQWIAFKKRLVDDKKARNKNIKSGVAYLGIIAGKSDEFINFMTENLGNYVTKVDPSSLSYLITHLNSFATQRKNQEEKESKKIKKKICKSAKKNDMKNMGVFHHRDQNYMRFFSNSSASLTNQKVKIEGSPEITYNMDISISGERKIKVDFTIDGNVLSITGGEPSTIIRKIMKNNLIKTGEMKAHMCFNIYKAMVKMAKDKNIILRYREKENMVYIDTDGSNNISIKKVSIKDNNETEIFNEKNFITNKAGREKFSAIELRNGVDVLGKYFNKAMNNLHRKYHKAVEKGMMKTKLPINFRNAPMKKILNGKNMRNFAFSTTVSGMSVNFEKNKFSISGGPLENPISSKNLGKILDIRDKSGNRIFDGKERDIIQGIYVALINELKQDPKINKSDYGVVDDVSGDLYIIDNAGGYRMVKKNDLNLIKKNLITGKKMGSVKRKLIMSRAIKLTDTQRESLTRNPFIMQKFVKAMNRRLGLIQSIRAARND